MFHLESSITAWRNQMLAAGIQTPVPMDELEIHLRDEIEEQLKSGLNGQEAFDFAIQKIGRAHMVQNEFKKVEVAREERKRRGGQIWLGAILGLLQLILIGAVLFNSDMTFGERMSGLAAIATSFLLVAVVRLGHHVLPVIRTGRNRTAIALLFGGALLVIWSGMFAAFILPNHEFPFGQWVATVLWASCPPLGAFLGLIWGIQIAAHKPGAAADS